MNPDSQPKLMSSSKAKDDRSRLTSLRNARLASHRASYALIFSGESYDPSDIGKAVELPRKEEMHGNIIPVKPKIEGKRAETEEQVSENMLKDQESLLSSSTVQLGSLDTIKSMKKSQNPPKVTVNIAIDAVVPPRLRKRPVSETVEPQSLPKTTTPPQKNSFSLNISDNLDKLMERASGLSELSNSADNGSRRDDRASKVTQESVSKESFETAEGLFFGDNRDSTIVLPKRPNAENLSRARQISASLAQQSEKHKQKGSHSDVECADLRTDQAPAKAWHGESLDGSGKAQADTLLHAGSTKVKEPLRPIVINREPSSTSSKYVSDPSLRENTVLSTNEHEGVRGSRKNFPRLLFLLESIGNSEGTDPKADADTNIPALNKIPQSLSQFKARHASPMPSICPPSTIGATRAHAPPALIMQESSMRPVLQHEDTAEADMPTDDEGFYDIDESLVVSHPTRAKSVKDHTRMPPKKCNKHRLRRSKRRHPYGTSSAGSLKPFSYNTLVNLLESMNGTVIGEEFEMLNLPVQEKQLIEKVIDSLSRLALVMTTDKHRFEIGIQRLEKAHRVLEGFL